MGLRGRWFSLLPAATATWMLGCGAQQEANLSPEGGSGSAGNVGTSDASASGNDGSASAGGDGRSPHCKPKTCAELNVNCGPVTDRECGGIIECGSCPSGQVCGGGGPNVCGTNGPTDAGTICTPATCASLNANCGPVSDGCGGLLQCGSCEAGAGCGLGGTPNVCAMSADGSACVPRTCAEQGLACGPAGDGCGNVLDCGSCAAGKTCGGGGTPGVCGSPACTPRTCAEQQVACGPVGDGCGNVLSCGGCTAPKTCGGGGTAGQCGCTGMCTKVPECPKGTTTTLSGAVYDPAGNNPLYHALVYIPNDPSDPALASFPSGVTCDQCGATAAGSPLVTAYTGPDGKFTLQNVPVGQNITLVIQLGRWRRKFQVNIANSCAANPLPDKLTMPSTRAQGDIPLIAMVTGNVDEVECVLRKMGVAQSEFTNPDGGGRIQFYLGGGQPHGGGARIDANTPTHHALFAGTDAGTAPINRYDMVLLACQGQEYAQDASEQLALRTYANQGGRVFATHYSYDWLYKNGDFADTAHWHVDQDDRGNATGYIDEVSNPKGADFRKWLEAAAVSTPNSGTVDLIVLRRDTDGVIPPTQQWLWRKSKSPAPDGGVVPVPAHFTFNTPVHAASANQCGRVLFSDFHVSNVEANRSGIGNYGKTFPSECDLTKPMNAQEKLFEFMIFDLGSCVQPYTPSCTPLTCEQQGIECGPAGDGCGNQIECGVCPSGQYCGGGGPGKCGASSCAPRSCAEQQLECGPAGNGCGSLIDCGPCIVGVCGGGGKPGTCGTQSCSPLTCAAQGIECGPAGDGCGNALECGTCPPGQVCGGGGPGKCGSPHCTPQTCSAQGIECGPAGDGCGNVLQCGPCPTGYVCGLYAPGQCGTSIIH